MSDLLKRCTALAAAVVLAAAAAALMTGCGAKAGNAEGSGDKKVEQEDASSLIPEDKGADVLNSAVPPEDFDPVGEYQDDTSERANMTITPEGEEGHYSVMIRWGSSADQTTIWEFEGDFDRGSGMLPYEKCKKIELFLDDNGYEKEDIKYEDGKGALLFYEGGFHWEDKKESAGQDCYFVKTGDLSETIIEEE